MGHQASKARAKDQGSKEDHGEVIVVSSQTEWAAKLEEAKSNNKMLVVDFTATWCGPCKMIAPLFEELSKKFKQLIFLKVDVDLLEAVASEWGVQAMPTFMFIKDGKAVETIVGADKLKLEEKTSLYAKQY